MPTDLLRQAEADLVELVGLPGAIRDKVKAGLAELRRLHDAIDAELARLTEGARATLTSLQALASTPAVQAERAGSGAPRSEGDAPPPPRPAEDGEPPLTL